MAKIHLYCLINVEMSDYLMSRFIYILYDEYIQVIDLSTFNSMSCHYLSTKYSIIVIVDGPIARLEHQ